MAIHSVDCNGPGIRRVGAGRGFWYRDTGGARIADPEVLDRIKGLAIPPAWRDVWICSDPEGHIQAVGTDARGRRQYRYHTEWQAARAREKHDRMVRFADRLPALRERVAEDLQLPGMPKDRVLAAAVRLLELGCFRIGGEPYAEENGTFGLATLRKAHLSIRGGTARFDYEAKGGQRQRCQTEDPEVVEVLQALKRRRSPADAELLAYRDDRDGWVDIRSVDINDYLRSAVGDEFSAKDFRTWVATVRAAVGFAAKDPPATERDRRRAVVEVATEVAEQLGNTPAVARSAYIDPRVVERFEAGETVEVEPEQVECLDALDETELQEVEAEVVQLVRRSRVRRRAG